jgi:hypothetical protein
MTLSLVPRSARALAEHLNHYYRVFKGVDADSVYVRMPVGGTFEVRHSITQAPVLQVTDAGIGGVLTAGAVPAGLITSAMIANGTIVGADIAPATITSDKLAGGIAVPAGSITTNEIADGTIQTGDLGNLQVTTLKLALQAATQFISVALSGSSIVASTPGTIAGSPLVITPSGGQVLCGVTLLGMKSTSPAFGGVVVKEGVTTVQFVAQDDFLTTQRTLTSVQSLGIPTSTSHTYALEWSVGAGTLSHVGGQFWVMELKR